MKILLDTHVFLWWLARSARLGERAITQIENADEVHVSVVSLWEAAIKTTTGKLEADIDELRSAISANHFIALPVTMDHVLSFARLPQLHKDSFDRMLVAQAITEPLRLLTADRKLVGYSSVVDLV